MEENKTLEIVTPEGYEIDRENSTFEKIMFKPVEKSWRSRESEDFAHTSNCCEMNGYFINEFSHIFHTRVSHNKINRNVFVTEKQAKSALAMAQISQIMENDSRFGGPITDEEWNDSRVEKYVIYRYLSNNIGRDIRYGAYEFLAFHAKKQRDLFLKENEDLVKEYLMLD